MITRICHRNPNQITNPQIKDLDSLYITFLHLQSPPIQTARRSTLHFKPTLTLMATRFRLHHLFLKKFIFNVIKVQTDISRKILTKKKQRRTVSSDSQPRLLRRIKIPRILSPGPFASTTPPTTMYRGKSLPMSVHLERTHIPNLKSLPKPRRSGLHQAKNCSIVVQSHRLPLLLPRQHMKLVCF